nr:putative ribonuclease H-like domain-containing protein [Tanacetum cinerariifolium]
MYCLVVTDDYSRFTWVFLLASKDETSAIFKTFITGIENMVDHKVKVIRCDNGTEFKNREMNQFWEMKGIMKQYRVARTPQQNEVANKRNRTIIKAARTMLADSKLPTTFWAEVVNTACYVQNRGLRKTKRKNMELPQTSVPISVADEAANKEMDDNLERAATTTSLDAEQDRGFLIWKLQRPLMLLEIDSLKRRVKKIERRNRSRTHGLKRLYKVGLSARVESSEDEGLGEEDASKQERIADINPNKDITLVSTYDEQMFDVDQDLGGDEVFVVQQDKKVVEKELDAAQIQVTTTATTPTISIDEVTLAQALAELNHVKPKTKAKGIKKKRNKPTTQAQQRKIICICLKNMEGKKLIDLKNKSFDSIEKMFNRAFKRVNTFVNYRIELVEESYKKAKEEVIEGNSKRVGTELEQKSVKKQKINKETA